MNTINRTITDKSPYYDIYDHEEAGSAIQVRAIACERITILSVDIESPNPNDLTFFTGRKSALGPVQHISHSNLGAVVTDDNKTANNTWSISGSDLGNPALDKNNDMGILFFEVKAKNNTPFKAEVTFRLY